MQEKLKSYLLNDHIFFALVIILVGIGAFGLGRVSADTEFNNSFKSDSINHSQVFKQIINTGNVPKLPTNDIEVIEELVASKSGTKYHLLNCGGAKQIKEENKIFFSSKFAAEAAGYKPAANCPGLQ